MRHAVPAVVDGQRVVAFCSNDYLGLANHPAIVAAVCTAAERWGVGSGASHVVSGHLRPHEALEERLAAFVGRERALYFTTGYMANLAIVPTLVERNDAIFADRLNHASLIDAALLARAEHVRYPHGDMDCASRTARTKPCAPQADSDRCGVQHGRRSGAAAGTVRPGGAL
jgi:8-amino-7-oxononanoate synthase